MLAVELLDSVTLERVTKGVEIKAKGLTGKPSVNVGGLFVWLKEDATKFEKLSIEPRTAPFERVEIPAAQVARPLHRVELKPLASYPFRPGITAIRGSLYEEIVPLGTAPIPVRGATIRLEWRDSDGHQQPGTDTAVTNDAGDFTSILRFVPTEEPRVENGALLVRLFVKRVGGVEKFLDLKPLQGRVTDGTYAWNDLH
ncbi:MAG: hypothetical protein U1E63_15835 [Burkholderiales bacterium]